MSSSFHRRKVPSEGGREPRDRVQSTSPHRGTTVERS